MKVVTQSTTNNVMLPAGRPANGSHAGENVGDAAEVLDWSAKRSPSGYEPLFHGAGSLDFTWIVAHCLRLAKQWPRTGPRFQRGGRGSSASCAANTHDAFAPWNNIHNALTPSGRWIYAEQQPRVSTD